MLNTPIILFVYNSATGSYIPEDGEITLTAPTVTNDTASVVQNSLNNVINVLANDVAGNAAIDTSSIVITQAPVNGSAAVVSGQIQYSPTNGYSGADTIKYKVSTVGGPASAVATVNITVTALPVSPPPPSPPPPPPPVVITPPNVVANSYTVNKNSLAADNQLNVLANDTAGTYAISASTLTITTAPSHGSASVISGQIRYAPTTDYVGSDTLAYKVSDINGNQSAACTVTITVQNTVTQDWLDPEAPYGGRGFGMTMGQWFNYFPQQISNGNKRSLSFVAHMSAPLAGLGFEICSAINNGEVGTNSSSRKSGGFGVFTFYWEFRKGRAKTASEPAGIIRPPGGTFGSNDSSRLAYGDRTHDRGSNGYNGDGRRYHVMRFKNAQGVNTPIDVTAGEAYHLILDNKYVDNNTISATGEWVSVNNMCLFRSINGVTQENICAKDLTPPRRFGVYCGDIGYGQVLSSSNGTSWTYRSDVYCMITPIYKIDGVEVQFNPGYRYSSRSAREQANIGGGGTKQIKQVWVHRHPTMKVKNIYCVLYWITSTRPTDGVTLTVKRTSGTNEQKWTKSRTITATTATDKWDNDITKINQWLEDAAANSTDAFSDHNRFTFDGADELEFVNGQTYEVILSSEAAGDTYRTAPVRTWDGDFITEDEAYDRGQVWRSSTASSTAPSYCIRTENTWSTSTKFWLYNDPDDAPPAADYREDFALPMFFERSGNVT
jgi:Bacterial Ig domain